MVRIERRLVRRRRDVRERDVRVLRVIQQMTIGHGTIRRHADKRHLHPGLAQRGCNQLHHTYSERVWSRQWATLRAT
eukprot:scaffold127497_cov32-Tisochrysis_lutea.AAC.3